MIRLATTIVFAFFTLTVSAQWYTRSYGVSNINELNEAQLKLALQHAEQKVKTGKTITFIGIGSTVLGGVFYYDAMNNAGDSWEAFWESMGEAGGGMLLMMAGTAAIITGVAFWTVGSNRRNSIEVSLMNFETSAYFLSRQPANFNFTQPPPVGLTIKINF